MMTSAMQFPTHVIGLMSGTSADGVDAALLFTDGKRMATAKESHFVAYDEPLRQEIFACMKGQGDAKKVEHSITEIHARAVAELIDKASKNVPRETISLIGFHGQTVLHRPEKGITNQLGDGAKLAKLTGISVVNDFRSNDVKNGGQGAPLAPLYHTALAATLEKPLMVVNIGGVANVTWIGEKDAVLAFDCGPGNALLDDWMFTHTGVRRDEKGEAAARGKIDEKIVAEFLKKEFFKLAPPKSLDRYDLAADVKEFSVENGAATLTAITAAAIARACDSVAQKPKQLLITGGGRHNPTLMKMIAERAQIKTVPVESVGWNGDMLEAEAFAYLAARSVQGLPLSLPSTTRVSRSVTGGVFYPA